MNLGNIAHSELNTSVADPLDRIKINEFIEGLLKAGSLISMIEGKKINTTNLFLLLLEKKDYQDFFVEITATESFKEAVLMMLYLHPSLVKSKFTKSYIRKVNNARSNNRARKKFIQ
jgi:hypothetical protein